MKLHKMNIVFTILMTSFSSQLISMDPPKLALDQNIEPHWITLIKNILLDKIPLQIESGEALEDQLVMSEDGINSFQYLTPKTQENIVYLLKLYMTSSSPFGKTPTTIHNTIDIFKDLFKQDEHLRKLFYDHVFCRQLIKFLAKKFNSSETEVAEKIQLGASREIVLSQNLLFRLCCDNTSSEKEFEETLQSLIEEFNDLDINYTYVDLKTPLMLAIVTGNLSFVRPLIKAGANPSARNRKGNTARDLLDIYFPNPLQTLEMPVEYRIALKALMGRKYH